MAWGWLPTVTVLLALTNLLSPKIFLVLIGLVGLVALSFMGSLMTKDYF